LKAVEFTGHKTKETAVIYKKIVPFILHPAKKIPRHGREQLQGMRRIGQGQEKDETGTSAGGTVSDKESRDRTRISYHKAGKGQE
jgi:hypothetical protein